MSTTTIPKGWRALRFGSRIRAGDRVWYNGMGPWTVIGADFQCVGIRYNPALYHWQMIRRAKK